MKTTQVLAGKNGDIVIPLSDKLLASLGWKEGSAVEFYVENGTMVMKLASTHTPENMKSYIHAEANCILSPSTWNDDDFDGDERLEAQKDKEEPLVILSLEELNKD